MKKSHAKVINCAMDIQANQMRGKDVFFQASPIIIAPLPHKKPSEFIYDQKQGDLSLALVADPRFGLPYGATSRLMLAWMTTEALRTQSRELAFERITRFAKHLGKPSSGGERGTLETVRQHALRLFTTSMSYTYEGVTEQWHILQGKNFHIIEEYKLWSKRYAEGNVVPFEKNDAIMVITLSEAFYAMVQKHAVPFDLRILTALQKSTLAMDIYLWMTYRYQSLKAPKTIAWASLKRQFGLNYKNDRSGRYNFRMSFVNASKLVTACYSSARFAIDQEGVTLKPSRSSVSQKSGDRA